jgi:hypothetical protein
MVFTCLSITSTLVVPHAKADLVKLSSIWWDSSWLYSKSITINHLKVTGSLTNFPVLISTTLNTGHIQSDADDLVFVDSTNTTQYAHEIESYNSVTGVLVAWVNVTSLSSVTDTVFYMYYGNSGSGNQQNPADVWDSNYVAVYHFMNASDSTRNHKSLTNHGGSFVAGTVANCVDLENDELDYLNNLAWYWYGFDTGLTMECWAYCESADDSGDNQYTGIMIDYLNSGQAAYFQDRSNSDKRWEFGGQGISCFTPLTFGVWAYFTGTMYPGPGATYRLYKNGALAASAVGGSTWGDMSSDDLEVGRDVASSRYYDGKYDELRLSKNITRSADWHTTSYNNMNSPSTFETFSAELIPQIPNIGPNFGTPSPTNGSTNQPLSLTWSISINDQDGDLFDWTIQCNNSQSSSANSASNGTKSLSISGLAYSTTYTVWVNATDSKNWTREWYTFTTRAQYVPNPPTSFAALDVSRTEIDLSWVKGTYADKTYIEAKIGSYPSSMTDGTNIYNGTGTSYPHTGLGFNEHWYYRAWSWNDTDLVWSSTYSSVNKSTKADQAPEYTLTMGNGNGSTNQPLSFSWNILIEDHEGDTFNWTIQCNNGQSSSANGASNGSKSLSLSGLIYGTTYTIWVNATDSYGATTSAWFIFTTRDPYSPSPPSLFSATAINRTEIDVMFSRGTNADYTYIEAKLGSYPSSMTDGTNIYNGTGAGIGVQEDFTTWTESDPSNLITVTNSSLVCQLHNQLHNTYAYKDFGADYFGWSFITNFEVTITAASLEYGWASFMSFANSVGDMQDVPEQTYGGFYRSGQASHKYYIYFTNNATVIDNLEVSPGTPYYCTITRSGSNGQIWTLDVYTDSGRTNLYGSIQTTDGNTAKFRYCMAVQSDSDGSAGSLYHTVSNLIFSVYTVEHTGLNPNEHWYYRAWTWNATDSLWSSTYSSANATTLPGSAPTFGIPTPANGSIEQPRSLTWSIPISDTDGDTFNWTIECSNGESSFANGASNGNKTLSISGLDYSTTYTVWVNATDIYDMSNHAWYTFTTIVNHPPTFGTPTPVNAATMQNLHLNWSIPISDQEGDTFDWTIQCNNSQSSSANGASNGTKYINLDLAYITTYTIWVNATDTGGSGEYTRNSYTFTTRPNIPPTCGTPTPTNGSIDNDWAFTWSIPINDADGNTFNWNISCSNKQTASATGASNGTKSLSLTNLGYGMTYTVWVNATDPTGSGEWTREWYTFTTKAFPEFGWCADFNYNYNKDVTEGDGLADDWVCPQSGNVTSLSFWVTMDTRLAGATLTDLQNEINSDGFNFSIYSDGGGIPGEELVKWNGAVHNFTTTISGPFIGNQAWLVPEFGFFISDYRNFYRIDITDFAYEFHETFGTTYWLYISMNNTGAGAGGMFYFAWACAPTPTGANATYRYLFDADRPWTDINSEGPGVPGCAGLYFIIDPPVNYETTLGTPSPTNGSITSSTAFTWQIPINDPEGDLITYTIQSSNGQSVYVNGTTNSTKTISLIGLSINTTYTIWVNATDPLGTGNWTRAWYTFDTLEFPLWDINQDGVVNYVDISAFANHYGETGTPGWIPEDVNLDGTINYLDASILITHYGESY